MNNPILYNTVANILGNLALSRALGDYEFKNNPSLPPEEQIVTCNPELIEIKHVAENEFIVVACDGIFKFI